MKMLSNIVKVQCENLSPPLPVFGERGLGGEGQYRLETRPPHPGPLPRKAGGEGGDIRVTSQLVNTPELSSCQHFRQARPRGRAANTRSNRSDPCQAFTLVELLVVLVIIGILSALVMGALRGAQQDTLAAKTRGTIAKIDAVLNEKFDEYLTKPLKFQEPTPVATNLRGDFPIENRVAVASPTRVFRMGPAPAAPIGLLRERVRLAATRDLMRMEMPDCVGDIFASVYPRPTAGPPTPTPLPSFNPYPLALPSSTRPLLYSTLLVTGYAVNPGSPVPLLMRLETPFAFQRIVQKVWQADQSLNTAGRVNTIAGGAARWADTFSNEELLYLIVEDSFVDGSPAIEAFAASEIGDRDEDGLKEFLDAWGNPIRWIRWPAGANTVTPMNPDPLNPTGSTSTDPFDPTFADVGFDLANELPANSGLYPFAPGDGLRPMVISAGPDGRFGIRFHTVVPPSQPAGPTSPTQGIAAPLFSPSTVMLGTTSFKRPAYWMFGMFNWPDPYCPRDYPLVAGGPDPRRGALLNSSIDIIHDPIGVYLNTNPTPLLPTTLAHPFIPHPNTDARYLKHSQDNVSNLDESGATP